MRFNELTEEAKKVAVKDYIAGWKETHPEENFSKEEARRLVIDSDDNYNAEGLIEEKMNSLLMLSGKVEELNHEQKEAIGYIIEAFNGNIKFDKDIDEVLNCEFCGGRK
jgi:hypothetical protein